MTVSFSIDLEGETFRSNVEVDLTALEVMGDLRRPAAGSLGGTAVFLFRRALGRNDRAISMVIRRTDRNGYVWQVWHAVVDLNGAVIHQHTK